MAALMLVSTDGSARDNEQQWCVGIREPRDGVVVRDVESRPWRDGLEPADPFRGDRQKTGWIEWTGDKRWNPEVEIWPTWHAASGDDAEPRDLLSTVHRHSSVDADRLRDSAKWMAAVVGLTLGVLVGTSPVSTMAASDPPLVSVAVGVVGLILLAVTLILVLGVIRPDPVSYHDIQAAEDGSPSHWAKLLPKRLRRNPLLEWRKTLQSEQDLYLPCGVKCLFTLRQTMLVEQLTLHALACAANSTRDELQRTWLQCAMEGRVARLRELELAASNVVGIADFYVLRRRSEVATYAGSAFAVAGILCIILAFMTA